MDEKENNDQINVQNNVQNNDQNDDKRIETEAYRSSKEIDKTLHDENSLFYKPFQLAECDVQALTLKTIYEEINIWGRENSIIRPGWKVENGKVYIPTIFSKICGVPNDIKLYRRDMNLLRQKKCTLLCRNFPLSKNKNTFKGEGIEALGMLFGFGSNNAYYSVLNSDGIVDVDKLLNAPFWRYRQLRSSAQKQIARTISYLCTLPPLWKYRDLGKVENGSIFEKLKYYIKTWFVRGGTNRDEEIMKITIFEVLNNIDRNLLRLLENFDYPGEIPKLIVYNNNKGSRFKFRDAVVITFMHLCGVDVMIYNPAGVCDIENYVKEEYYDIHMLEGTATNLPYKNIPLWYRIFKK